MDGMVCGVCMTRYCLCDKQYTPRDIAEQIIAGTVTRDTQFVASTDLAALLALRDDVAKWQGIAAREASHGAEVWEERDALRAERDALRERAEGFEALLLRIGELAHRNATDPTVKDIDRDTFCWTLRRWCSPEELADFLRDRKELIASGALAPASQVSSPAGTPAATEPGVKAPEPAGLVPMFESELDEARVNRLARLGLPIPCNAPWESDGPPASQTPQDEAAWCGDCGAKLEAVRPGKFQHVGPCPASQPAGKGEKP